MYYNRHNNLTSTSLIARYMSRELSHVLYCNDSLLSSSGAAYAFAEGYELAGWTPMEGTED
jgi:hypothetical protein